MKDERKKNNDIMDPETTIIIIIIRFLCVLIVWECMDFIQRGHTFQSSCYNCKINNGTLQ